MRFLDYPGKGRPPALTTELEELLVLTFGAMEAVNVERWALHFGAKSVPVVPGTMRRSAYETDVVGTIHRLGQRYWERRGEAAMWERPFATGEPGRPPAVDISLFNAERKVETRVEFGVFSQAKLKSDANKLADLAADAHPDFPTVESFIVLWTERKDALTKAKRRDVVSKFKKAVSGKGMPPLTLLSVSGGDLFVQERTGSHWMAAGLFQLSQSSVPPSAQLSAGPAGGPALATG